MAVKHNNWMKILAAVFNALATLFGAIKIEKKTDNDESPVNATSYIGE